MRKMTTTPESACNSAASQGNSRVHESAERQVSGKAIYVDDMPLPRGTCHAAVGLSDVTCGVITELDLSAVRAAPGVIDVISAQDVPGQLDIAPVFDGDPVLADGEIKYHGQVVFAVLATSMLLARQAAKLALVKVSDQPAILSVEQAKAQGKTVRPAHTMQHGDAEGAINSSSLVIEGELSIGGQEHFYLEGQISLVVPQEENRMLVFTSSQHPSEVQKLVAEALGVRLHHVTVDMRRMGGAFGGKETQAAQWACIAAILAQRNQCPVKLRLPRSQDMQTTGKRHSFVQSFKLGADNNGRLNGCQISINGLCGHSADLSDAIVDRAMFHADNAYYLADCHITGHRWFSNMASHTAFRGFGGPQGMLIAEAMMDAIARNTGQDPLTVRLRNLYDDSTGNHTHYGMQIKQNNLADLIGRLEHSADYWGRREAIRQFNLDSIVLKKGLALTPVKFGISFTAKYLNQAGALVHVYTDGSVQVNHGGTEMGQGLHTKISQIVSRELGIPLDWIDVTATRTDKVPNTSPTAASSATDINGKAVQSACQTIRQRIADFLAERNAVPSERVTFTEGLVVMPGCQFSFAEAVQQAYQARISLSATGFYKTPEIHYDRDKAQGQPFFYFAYGAAVSEVTIDTLTGEYKVDRVDILHDVGNSINPAIDRGQIEGGFIQGMGWLTSEEVIWSEDGKLLSDSPATYKIPSIGDTPPVFNVAFYPQQNSKDTIYHSKAVGEPPFMLAMSVWCALKDAVSSLSGYRQDPPLDPPATPEKVLRAIHSMEVQP